jgi:hypothetical protein
METTVELKDLWTVGAVLMGFQLAAFTWRLTRELNGRDLREEYHIEKNQDVDRWFPPADYLNLASLLVIVGGVFLVPILSLGSARFAERALGLSAILFVGYPFAVLGHYNLLFSRRTTPPGEFSTVREKAVIVVTILLSVFYAMLLSCVRHS